MVLVHGSKNHIVYLAFMHFFYRGKTLCFNDIDNSSGMSTCNAGVICAFPATSYRFESEVSEDTEMMMLPFVVDWSTRLLSYTSLVLNYITYLNSCSKLKTLLYILLYVLIYILDKYLPFGNCCRPFCSIKHLHIRWYLATI